MHALAQVGLSTAAALAAAFLGSCVGFLIARILVEKCQLVNGPAAGVLLVLSVSGLALLSGVIGFVLSLRWLQRRTDTE